MFIKQAVVLLFIVFSAVSLTNAQQKVDVNKDIDLLKVYQQYEQDGYGTPEIYKKLANGFYFKSNYKKAKFYFEKLFQFKQPTTTLLTRYKQTLRALKIDTSNNKYLNHATL